MWISVKDRLPETKTPVLMYVTCGKHFNIEEGEYKGSDKWINCWCSLRGKDLYPVTYWQPLPKPPLAESTNTSTNKICIHYEKQNVVAREGVEMDICTCMGKLPRA